MPGDVSVLSVEEQVNRLLFFQIILTEDRSAHEFVILNIFAVDLTNHLNPEALFITYFMFVRKK